MIGAITSNSAGTALVVDYAKIRQVTPEGHVTTTALTAPNAPEGVLFGLTAGPEGYLYAYLYGQDEILKFSPAGDVTVLAGAPYQRDELTTNGWADGIGTAARFANANDLCVDAQGNVFVADTFNHRIRKVTPDGTVTTMAGSGSLGNSLRDDDPLEGPPEGPALSAHFRFPRRITVDASGTLYVADTYNKRIAKITPEGQVKTVYSGFREPYDVGDVAAEADGNVLFTERMEVRRLSPNGEVTTVASFPDDAVNLAHIAVLPDGSFLAANQFRIFKVAKDGGSSKVLAGFFTRCPPE